MGPLTGSVAKGAQDLTGKSTKWRAGELEEQPFVIYLTFLIKIKVLPSKVHVYIFSPEYKIMQKNFKIMQLSSNVSQDAG